MEYGATYAYTPPWRLFFSTLGHYAVKCS